MAIFFPSSNFRSEFQILILSEFAKTQINFIFDVEMLQQTLRKWLNQFKQYFFTYSNGFYHLPYSSKTPEDLVESLANYPFMKHDRVKQSVYANTPFCSGGFNYQKLEEGLWVIYSKMRYSLKEKGVVL
ncbi:hypothetical protein [Flavobacterium aquidurense]|uniref:hypothetical protein n=1 Tax=Flavobacterium aquidurense TaxID=362413 RepID=UPI002855C343|nr:hypothetical protein [Flavobacterium aquidurense]MDR7370241.1 hypothetical protein [Flavobacterium aquidurense]